MSRDYPLSQPQYRLWHLNQGATSDIAFNVPIALRLTGPLNEEVLGTSLDHLVTRHEVLRTLFIDNGDEPRQQILDEDDLRIPKLVMEDVDDAVARATELAQIPFDLAAEVPLRLHLLRECATAHVLVVMTHHVACDGQSLDVLVRELAACYRTFSAAEGDPDLADLPVRYVDYVLWKQEVLGEFETPTEESRRMLDFWQTSLAGAPGEVEVPHDSPDPAGPCEIRQPLAADDMNGLEQLARQTGTTAGMICHAAVAAVLMRAGAGHDLPIGTIAAGRDDEALDGVVGFFNNPLVIRSALSPSQTLGELLTGVKQSTVAALAHQDVPFDWVVRDLNPARTARPPLYQVSVEFHHANESAQIDLGTVQATEVALPLTGAKLELSWDFAVVSHRCGFPTGELQVSFDPSRYDAATVTRLARWTVATLRSILRSPDLPIGELELAGADTELPQRPGHPDLDRCVVQRVRDHARRAPTTTAVSTGAGSDGVSYAALVGRASAAARRWRDHGVRPGQLVPVFAERGAEVIEAFLALRTIGAVYLPVDPQAPLQRRRLLCEQVDASHLVADSSPTARAAVAEMGLPVLELSTEVDPEDRWTPLADATDQVAYTIFTSGSTGTPKGAMVKPRGMVNNMLCEAEALQIDRPLLSAMTAPLTFDISVWQMLTPLLFGGTVRPVAAEVARDPIALFDLAAEERWQILQVVPSLLESALDEWDSGVAASRLDLVRLGVTGEALPPTVATRWLQRFPDIPLVNCYGPTECSDDVTHAVIAAPDTVTGPRAPIGRPIRGSRLYVLDEALRPVPTGAPGELYIGGLVVGRGYLGDPARTASTFVADPFSTDPGARMYRTGDIVRLRADDLIEFCGRQDHQVKVRGRRIELGEIEHALRSAPGVQSAAAAVVTDRQASSRLVGFVTGRCDVELVTKHLTEVLPRDLVPSLTVLDHLPLNANGKIDRGSLPQLAAVEVLDASEPPQTPAEKTICHIFGQTLSRTIGRHDDFFDHGGHSLVALRVLRQINAELGTDLTMSDLFGSPTPAGLAAFAADAASSSVSTVQALADLERPAPVVHRRRATAGVPDPRRVLLTGATGFLGVHLLRSLLEHTNAEVICLVRCPNLESGLERLRDAVSTYALEDDLSGDRWDRVVVVPSNLAQPYLGLGESELAALTGGVDLIIHAAAEVSFAKTYDQLRSVNVDAADQLLTIAARSGAAFHLISTTGALGAHASEEARCDLTEVGPGGYEQTKWVGERLTEKAGQSGVPVVIHRPGRLSGSTGAGTWSPNDAFWLFVRACLEVGAVPRDGVIDFIDALAPVDEVARAVVALATDRAVASRSVFHHVGKVEHSFDEVADRLRADHRLTELSEDRWRAVVTESAAEGSACRGVDTLLSLAEGGELANHVVHDSSRCDAALARLGITPPVVTANLMDRYLEHLVSAGA